MVVTVPEVVQPEERFKVTRGGVADLEGRCWFATLSEGDVLLVCPTDGLVEVDYYVVVVYTFNFINTRLFSNDTGAC